MSRLSKPNEGMAEARPFAGMSQVHEHAAGVDVGAHEIMVCVAGVEGTQLVRSFGSYTVDLQAIGKWLEEHEVETVATPAPTAGAVWKARGCTGFHSSRNWREEAFTAT